MILSINIEFGVGGLLIDHLKKAIEIAKIYNCEVKYTMHEKNITVYGDSDPYKILSTHFNLA